MHNAFDVHLDSHRARFDEGLVIHFGDPQGERASLGRVPTVHPLAADGVLRVTGPDAAGFLQGQFTNDIRELDDARAQLTTWCTPQGRVLATFLAWREQDDYLLQLPRDLLQPVRTRLQRYILRARVQISDASPALALIGVAGPDAHSALSAALGTAPEGPMQVIEAGDGVRVLALRPGLHQIAATIDRAAAAWDAIAARARPCGTPGWDWHRIQRCLPTVTAATQERFVPQMLDLEHSGGVSFSKGCYPGQEIVARSQYLGEVKRRLFRVTTDTHSLASGAEVSAEGAPVGMVVNAAPAPHGGWDALAVLQIEAAARGSLALAGTATPLTLSGACH
jgi:folate-binding protein YgfZ